MISNNSLSNSMCASYIQGSDLIYDRRLTVGSPSGLEAKLQLNTFVRFAAVLLLLLTMGVGKVLGAEETWTHTFSEAPTWTPSSGTSRSMTINKATWSVSTGTAVGSPSIWGVKNNAYSSYGLQFGNGGSNYYPSITLSTDYFSSYQVSAVTVNLLINGSVSTTITVTQGKTTIGSPTFSTKQSWLDFEANTNSGTSGTLTLSISTTQAIYIHSIEVTYSTTPACSNTVTPAEGENTNVAAMTFSSASVATCSSTASDRQVTVTITPSSCYSVPSSTRLSVTGTSASYVSGPTDNGNGTYSFVYGFAQNATGTSTFAASLDTKTTYTVQYNAGATTCTGGNAITGSHADDTKTCGTNLTLPGETFHTTGYTQTGWAKSSCGSKTTNLEGSYTIDAAQTFYPVWTANSYTVTWMVNNITYSAGGSTSVSYGSRVSTLPTDPDPGDYCGNKFMGWTTDAEYVHGTSPLFTTAGSAPTASGAQTFYAVFADYAE